MRAIAKLDLVRRLLIHEAAERTHAESQNPTFLIEAAERVLDKLRTHLSKRIGQEGFRTLLSRALSTTTPIFPDLSVVHVAPDGSLVGLREAAIPNLAESPKLRESETQQVAKETQQSAVEGAVALVGHLLGLLVTFIGEDLTLRILSAVWPELATKGLVTEEATGAENESGENERP